LASARGGTKRSHREGRVAGYTREGVRGLSVYALVKGAVAGALTIELLAWGVSQRRVWAWPTMLERRYGATMSMPGGSVLPSSCVFGVCGKGCMRRK
jgi:hypothetical protein